MMTNFKKGDKIETDNLTDETQKYWSMQKLVKSKKIYVQ